MMAAAAVPYRRVPWLSVDVEPGQGEHLIAVIGCRQCHAEVRVVIAPEDQNVGRHGAALTHYADCPVPVALARAAKAHLN